MDKIYNKLVRDNIPEIIKSTNKVAKTRTLTDQEYRGELLKKLKEECNEVIESRNTDETLEEIADVYEVLSSILKLENKNINDVIEIARKKRIDRGGFEKRIFLERVED